MNESQKLYSDNRRKPSDLIPHDFPASSIVYISSDRNNRRQQTWRALRWTIWKHFSDPLREPQNMGIQHHSTIIAKEWASS